MLGVATTLILSAAVFDQPTPQANPATQKEAQVLVETDLQVSVNDASLSHADGDPARPYFTDMKFGEGTLEAREGKTFVRWKYVMNEEIATSSFLLHAMAPGAIIRDVSDKRRLHVGDAFGAKEEQLLELCDSPAARRCWPIRMVYTPLYVFVPQAWYPPIEGAYGKQGLDRNDVLSVIRANIPAIKACVAAAANDAKPRPQKLVLKFVIVPTGKTKAASIEAADAWGAPIANCVSDILRHLRFPEYAAGNIPVTFPIPISP